MKKIIKSLLLATGVAGIFNPAFAQTAEVKAKHEETKTACVPLMQETAANGAPENAEVTPEIRACVNSASAYNRASVLAAQELIVAFQNNEDLPKADRDQFAHYYASLINSHCTAKINTLNENAAEMSLPEKAFNLNNVIYTCQAHAVGALSSHVGGMVENQPNGEVLIAQLHSNGLTPESYIYSAMGAAFCVSAALGDQISAEFRQETDSAYEDELERCVAAMDYAFKPN